MKVRYIIGVVIGATIGFTLASAVTVYVLGYTIRPWLGDGAWWVNTAWGRYWGWDPKETATLITALLYAGYLHAHNLSGRRGTRSAVLLILGFVATAFTFFGNLFFSGLHAYSGF